MMMTEQDETGISKNYSKRYGGKIRLFVIHTQEGNGTARSLANFLQNPNSGVSYHYSIDDNECFAVVDTDYASWSVLDANGYTINLCYGGSRASMSRDEWIRRYSRAIDFTGWLIARDARKYGFSPYVIGHDEIRAGKSGTTDHYGITRGLGIGDHTDVGGGYPWDLLRSAIDKYMKNPAPTPAPAPVVNMIDECRKANEWLGAARDPEERPCPDGRGRFRYYEHGAIYWTPETGARAIPEELIEKYGELVWEQGTLGYPTNDRTILNGPDGQRWGVVQGFERGNLYRRDGFDAHAVYGDICKRWAESGYENGPLGWPTSDEYDFDLGRAQSFENGRIFWPGKSSTVAMVGDGPLGSSPKPVPAPPVTYLPTDQERRATPTTGMTGGISYFAGSTDASTRGRNMGISGEPADSPHDPWFCAMRFAYTQTRTDPNRSDWIKPVPGTSDLGLKAYLPGRRLLVTNPKNGRKIVVRPADWGPAPAKRVIDVSRQALDALGAQTDDQVVVEWVDPATPLGPKQ